MEKSGGQKGRWEELATRGQYRPSEIAKLTRVSLRTLQRHFRSHYNVTISTWLRSLRLNEAYARLVAGHSVKEVAYGLGFKQLSHFSREFKKMYGVPPSCLRGGEQPKHSVILHVSKAQDRFVMMASDPTGDTDISQ